MDGEVVNLRFGMQLSDVLLSFLSLEKYISHTYQPTYLPTYLDLQTKANRSTSAKNPPPDLKSFPHPRSQSPKHKTHHRYHHRHALPGFVFRATCMYASYSATTAPSRHIFQDNAARLMQ